MDEPAKTPERGQEERAPFLREAIASVITRRLTRTRAEGEEGGEAEEQEETLIEIAISSEKAVQRWDWRTGKYFDEVLGHDEGEIDLSYAVDGLPFFVDHTSGRMVGLVHPVRRDDDGVLRGPVRFGAHPDAAWVEADIKNGIRKKISVGYDYDDTNYTETVKDGRAIRRISGWRPLEASSVPIPADYEVGVGRSARPGARRPELIPGAPAAKAKENTVSEQVTTAPPAADVRAGILAEHREITELAKIHKMTERIPEWIGAGVSVAQVQKDILEAHRAKSDALLANGGGGDLLQLTEREAKQFSFARAIANAAAGKRGYEHEVSDELYRKLNRQPSNPNALLVPNELLGRYTDAPRKRLEVATSGAGQQLKFTEYGGFLGLLRNRMFLTRLGAQTLSGLQGDVSFVTQPSANTFQWGAETATPTATNFGTGIKTLAPKNGAALTKYTRQLLAQSVESVEGLVQDDLMRIIALAIDAAGIAGSGSTQPTGIISTSGIGSVTMGTAGAVPTFPKLVDMWTEVATDNADTENMAYLTTPGIAGYLQKTEQFSATTGKPIWTWRGGGVGDINGQAAYSSNQVPSTGTKGSNTGSNHTILFGDFSNVVIGEWGATELVVDPYKSKPVIIEVAAHVMVDIMLRYPEGLCAMVDARTS